MGETGGVTVGDGEGREEGIAIHPTGGPIQLQLQAYRPTRGCLYQVTTMLWSRDGSKEFGWYKAKDSRHCCRALSNGRAETSHNRESTTAATCPVVKVGSNPPLLGRAGPHLGPLLRFEPTMAKNCHAQQ